ncbi:MAG TPA: hypothetical protein VF532_12900 [Candidatus Angelobacter sp.]
MFADRRMEQANTNSKPLPLFRAEALAARQQGTQGDILLVRPLSLAFLSWLGVAIAALAIAYLFVGHYSPTQRMEGTVTSAVEEHSSSLEAGFDLPQPNGQTLRPGQDVLIRCTTCIGPLPGTIVSVSRIPSDSSNSIHFAMIISLAHGQQLPAGTQIQAEIQLEKKPLIAWLLEKPGT